MMNDIARHSLNSYNLRSFGSLLHFYRRQTSSIYTKLGLIETLLLVSILLEASAVLPKHFLPCTIATLLLAKHATSLPSHQALLILARSHPKPINCANQYPLTLLLTATALNQTELDAPIATDPSPSAQTEVFSRNTSTRVTEVVWLHETFVVQVQHTT